MTLARSSVIEYCCRLKSNSFAPGWMAWSKVVRTQATLSFGKPMREATSRATAASKPLPSSGLLSITQGK